MRSVSRNWFGGIRLVAVVALGAMWGCAAGDESINGDDSAQSQLELQGPKQSVAGKKQPGQQQKPKHHRHWRGKGKHRGHTQDDPGGSNSGVGGMAAAAGGSTSTGNLGSGGNGTGTTIPSMGGSMSMGGAIITTGAAGTYLTGTCGNGVLEARESCDDGNLQEGDGCSQYCYQEAGWNCFTGTGTCVPVVCGNGLLELRADGTYETCEDGNTTSSDGCSAECSTEVGWDCNAGACVKAVCGNLQYECAMGSNGEYTCEQCEDGNTLGGDGCSASCSVEPNWTCDDAGCHQVVCGDRRMDCTIDAQGNDLCEACDDGNQASGDGCNASCSAVEAGYYCEWQGVCRQAECGNGLYECSADANGNYSCESCDDGNRVSGDGCSSTCEYEGSTGVGGGPGYGGAPSFGGVPVTSNGGAMPVASAGVAGMLE